jgi:hypothetical protein
MANPKTTAPTRISSRGVVTVPPIKVYCDGRRLLLIATSIAEISGLYVNPPWSGFGERERSVGKARKKIVAAENA